MTGPGKKKCTEMLYSGKYNRYWQLVMASNIHFAQLIWISVMYMYSVNIVIFGCTIVH